MNEHEQSCTEWERDIQEGDNEVEKLKLEINHINEKIQQYDEKMKCLESKFAENRETRKHKIEIKDLQCTVCDKTFSKNCDLENHVTTHPEAKPFPCKICGKILYTKWRLKVHTKGNHATKTRFCHNFNSNKVCPFEKFGCKFKHEQSEKCKYGISCSVNLCQLKTTMKKINLVLIKKNHDVLPSLEKDVVSSSSSWVMLRALDCSVLFSSS